MYICDIVVLNNLPYALLNWLYIFNGCGRFKKRLQHFSALAIRDIFVLVLNLGLDTQLALTKRYLRNMIEAKLSILLPSSETQLLCEEAEAAFWVLQKCDVVAPFAPLTPITRHLSVTVYKQDVVNSTVQFNFMSKSSWGLEELPNLVQSKLPTLRTIS